MNKSFLSIGAIYSLFFPQLYWDIIWQTKLYGCEVHIVTIRYVYVYTVRWLPQPSSRHLRGLLFWV